MGPQALGIVLGLAQTVAPSRPTDNIAAIQGAPLSTKPTKPRVQSMGVRIGEVMVGRLDNVLITSKARMRVGTGPNDEGTSRFHLIRMGQGRLM